MQIAEILTVVGVPMLRSIAGWACKALEDNVITPFERKLLFSTVIRVGIIGLATYYGLNGLGINVDMLGASFAAILMDKFFESQKS